MVSLPPVIKARGVRLSMPQGYVLGRVSGGSGEAELIPLVWFSLKQVATGVVAAAGSGGGDYVDLGAFLSGFGALYAGQYYPLAMASRTLSFPSGSGSSVAKCLVAPTSASALLYVTKDLADFTANGAAGLSTMYSISFALGATTGVVTSLHTVAVARGDIIYVICDFAWNELAIADIQILLRAAT